MQSVRSGDHHNSPIKIDGEGAITYEIVRNFMETMTNTVKVDRGLEEKYLEAIGSGEAVITDDMVDDATGKVDLSLYQSYSTFSAIGNAISYLFKLAGIERPPEFVSSMNNLWEA